MTKFLAIAYLVILSLLLSYGGYYLSLRFDESGMNVGLRLIIPIGTLIISAVLIYFYFKKQLNKWIVLVLTLMTLPVLFVIISMKYTTYRYYQNPENQIKTVKIEPITNTGGSVKP